MWGRSLSELCFQGETRGRAAAAAPERRGPAGPEGPRVPAAPRGAAPGAGRRGGCPHAARDDGDGGRALAFYLRALQLDAGIVRRLGLALPATLSASGGDVPKQAAAYLEGSPRFSRDQPGFRIEVSGDDASGAACLVGPQGEQLACAAVTPRAGEDATAVARRLAAEFHALVFAPRVDLTQADLRSLDGSTTAGRDRGAKRIQGILDALTGESPR